ncbi:MAG: MFS transporter [Boseongicola sp. SB0676_bin_33]|nr:MFS transporter [Boseongicola sp. SB0676_bin_33]
MQTAVLRKRIWGWFFFDWASQPYHTLLVTFVFGPYFAAVATQHFMGSGLPEQAADARAQSLWSLGLTVSSLVVGLGGPVLGALADAAGRRMPWIIVFSALCVLGSGSLWWVMPDGSNLAFGLIVFGIGFIGAELALIFTNAQLPSLGPTKEIGKISGSGYAFGYLGGLVSLLIMLALFLEQASGTTIVGLAPALGLDPEAREGTRFVGPLAAAWFAVFMVPYFLWVREEPALRRRAHAVESLKHLLDRLRALPRRPSLASFLGGSMLYRDGLNGLYAFGGTYAVLVLNWEITQVGIFGIIGLISAAVLSWIGGGLDRRFGPKPVITFCVLALIVVCATIMSVRPDSIFGLPVAAYCGASGAICQDLPQLVFMACGALIGGLGGILQAASRTLMARHVDPDTATEAFGLYGLAGRATAFRAPLLIGIVTAVTGSVALGMTPIIALFASGAVLLRWTNPDGDRAEK